MCSFIKQAVFLLSTAIILLFSTQVYALDYPSMSNDELHDLRGAIRNAPPEEQERYRKEWQIRLDKMSKEEKAHFEQEARSADESLTPIIPGKGYDSQGTGVILYGGEPSGN